MTSGQHEAIAIDPARAIRIVLQGMPIEDGTDLRRAERQAEMAGLAGVDGVHREASGLIGGLGEERGLQDHDA
jgi:hypothetical protein